MKITGWRNLIGLKIILFAAILFATALSSCVSKNALLQKQAQEDAEAQLLKLPADVKTIIDTPATITEIQ